jgi:hypothetical protein
LRHLFAPVTDFTAKVFTEAHAAGVLRDFDPNVMGAYVGGGIRNTLKWRRADGSSLTEPERRQIAEMCWSAIARQQPAAMDD